MTTKSYSTKANARRALAAIGKAAACKAAQLITETAEGKFEFNLEAAEKIQNDYDCSDDCNCEAKSAPAAVIPAAPVEDHEAYVFAYEVHGQSHCPHCGIYLDNGVGVHRDEVNGKWVTHTKTYEFWCMACGGEFGPLLPGKTDKASGAAHPNMKTSLKLDRRLFCKESGIIYRNAFQMWKANPEWMTTGQQDRLTAQLYKAAKEGVRLEVTINGRTFYLADETLRIPAN